MYPLIKRLNIDILRHIHSYNCYSRLDLEYFKYLHKQKFRIVLYDLKCFFYFIEYVLDGRTYSDSEDEEEFDNSIRTGSLMCLQQQIHGHYYFQ